MKPFHFPTSVVPETTATLNLGKDDLRWLEAFLTNINVSVRATVPTPINDTDATTKAYVDARVGLQTWEEADGSPSISAPTTIRLDQADGFVLTNPSAGVARLDLAAIPNSVLANSSVTVTAGTGLTGGGAVALGAAVTVSLDTPVTVARGGTGAATAAGARTNLGSTTVGDAVYIAVSAAAARTTLGSTTVGDAVFIAASAAAARTAIGTVIGTDVQAWDADLDAVAALAATAGMLARTGAGAFAVRTIAGTASNISVANGDGALGAPTINLVDAGPGATGPIGSATVAPVVTIDAKGRVTALTSATISTGLSAATQAEMEAATSITVATTPGRTQFHPGVAKAWVVFQLNGTQDDAYNSPSVTDNGAGSWDPVWGTDFSGGSHCDQVAYQGTGILTARILDSGAAAGSTAVRTVDNVTQVATDPGGGTIRIHCVAFGDQA